MSDNNDIDDVDRVLDLGGVIARHPMEAMEGLEKSDRIASLSSFNNLDR